MNPRILRWSLVLCNYDYVLEHRSSERMHHVDALSRNYSILIITENSFERNLSIVQNLDPRIVEIKTKLQQAENKFFELNNVLVYRKGQGLDLCYILSMVMIFTLILILSEFLVRVKLTFVCLYEFMLTCVRTYVRHCAHLC